MSPWAGSLRMITATWQVQASERAYWGTTGRGSAHIEGRTSRDALDHLYWINDLKGNDEKRGARQCFQTLLCTDSQVARPVVLKYGEVVLICVLNSLEGNGD